MSRERTVVIQGKGTSKFYTETFMRDFHVTELWKLNNDGSKPIPTRHFEIHDPIHFTDKQIIDEYTKENGISPLLYKDFKIIRRYDMPISELNKRFGVKYYLNTICYQIAIAIHEGFDRICLSGCDKYATHEQPEVDGVRWWVNEAINAGVKVVVTHMSDIKLNDLQIDRINRERKDFEYI